MVECYKKYGKKIIATHNNSVPHSIEGKQKKLKMIDLCAGTGAFTYAFEQTNLVHVVFANDFDESSKKIYD